MENGIVFDYQARYCKIGSLDRPGAELWFVLHGYGQLAPYFVKKFQFLEEKGHCIIAPEGLNRFYLKGFNGRVGATWMTKEDRLRDIDNYINYLDAVYRKEVGNRQDLVVNLLGFSQGSATISRWIAQGEVQYQRLFIWAGVFPVDLNFESDSSNFQEKSIYLVYGTNDPYITKGRLAGHFKTSQQLGIHPQVVEFDGEHDIDAVTLNEILANDK